MQKAIAGSVRDTTEMTLEILRFASGPGPPPRMGPGYPLLSLCADLVETGHLIGWVVMEGAQIREILGARISHLEHAHDKGEWGR